MVELFEPSAAGRIANSNDLFVGLYCYTTLLYFQVENDRSNWNFWELAIGERGQLEVKDEKESMPLVDMVAIVADVYGAVCQLYLRLRNTNLWRCKSSVVTNQV